MTASTDQPSTTTRPFYRRRAVLVTAGVLAVPVLALAWWLGSPLFLDTVVDEAFPVATTAPPVTAPVEEAAPDSDTIADGSTNVTPSSGPEASTPTSADEEPRPLLTGQFAGADDFHEGSGTATIYELADGSRVLRFEDFEVTNGPDLHVLVSAASQVTGREDLEAAGYVDLGKLKGNIGSQNYELGDDIDLSGPITVTIYCDPFHVVFATATLAPAA